MDFSGGIGGIADSLEADYVSKTEGAQFASVEKSTAVSTIVHLCRKSSEPRFCKTRAIAFCGSGTTRSWEISTVSIRR